jgi:hypothetical protein
LILILKFSLQLKYKNSTEILVSAFTDSIREIFHRFHLKFDVIIYENVSFELLDVVNELQKNQEISTKVYRLFYESELNPRQILKPAIIFCSSYSKVLEFFQRFGLENVDFSFPQRFRFLFYAEETSQVDSMNANELNEDIGHISQFSYFIVNLKGEIRSKII